MAANRRWTRPPATQTENLPSGPSPAHRRGKPRRPPRPSPAHRRGKPRIYLRDELRVAHPQVLIRHPPAPRQQVERKLRPLLLDVAPEPLEPLQRRLCRPLGALDDRPPLGLVRRQTRSARHRHRTKRPCQGDRVLHRQLRPRPDREVRRVRASPSNTTLSEHQRRLRTVTNRIHFELFASSGRPSNSSQTTTSRTPPTPCRKRPAPTPPNPTDRAQPAATHPSASRR